jgi:hypothetical protein
MDNSLLGLELDTAIEYAWVVFKVTFAVSPIIVIGIMLACAREDEEEEKAKKELSEKLKCCKSC